MPERLPDIAKRGVLIEEPNPQEAIRKAAEANKEFIFREEIVKLRRWINGDPDSDLEGIKDRLYPSIHTPWFQGNLPPLGVAIEPLNKNTLATYRLVPDGYGLPHKITFNEKHFVTEYGEDGQLLKVYYKFGDWVLGEIATHETGHHWQQMLGKDPFTVQKRVTHNKEYRDKQRQIGLYCNAEGKYFKLADVDGPYGIWARERGLTPPADIPRDEAYSGHYFVPKKEKGKSTTHKECCPNCGEIRYSTKKNPKPIWCGECTLETGQIVVYVRPDAVDQTIYSASTSDDEFYDVFGEALKKIREEKFPAQEAGESSGNSLESGDYMYRQ